MQLSKTAHYSKVEKRFFKQHRELLGKYTETLKLLQYDPFEPLLKTHRLRGHLQEYYSCSLTYSYHIIMTIKIVDDQIILMDIGSHNKVY